MIYLSNRTIAACFLFFGGFRCFPSAKPPETISKTPPEVPYSSPPRIDAIQEYTGLDRPMGVAVDSQGYIYIADLNDHRVIKLDRSLRFIGAIGADSHGHVKEGWQDLGDGAKSDQPGGFNGPHHVLIERDGNLLVTELYGHRVQRFDPHGRFIGALGINKDGNFTEGFTKDTTVSKPHKDGVFVLLSTAALDPSSNLVIADYGSNNLLKFDKAGNYIGRLGASQDGTERLSTWSKSPSPDTSLSGWVFDRLHQAVINNEGEIFVADTWNHRIQRISAEGHFMGWIGATQRGEIVSRWSSALEPGSPSRKIGGFETPVAVALDDSGNLLVLECSKWSRLQIFSPKGNFLGWAGKSATGEIAQPWSTTEQEALNGHEKGAFNEPYGLEVRNRVIYVADYRNHRLQVIPMQEQ
jgi:DNA-binding beta-propeller fold protein YncE